MSVRVCGLDLSLTASGYALPDGTVGTLRPRVRDGSRWRELRGCERLSWIRDEILALEYTHGIELFAIEGFSYGSKGRAVFDVGGLGWLVRVALWDAGIGWVDVAPSTLKKYACGKGNASKPEVIQAAWKRLGYDGTDDNQADALWLRAAVSHAAGHPVVKVPQSHRDALAAIELEPSEAA